MKLKWIIMGAAVLVLAVSITATIKGNVADNPERTPSKETITGVYEDEAVVLSLFEGEYLLTDKVSGCYYSGEYRSFDGDDMHIGFIECLYREHKSVNGIEYYDGKERSFTVPITKDGKPVFKDEIKKNIF